MGDVSTARAVAARTCSKTVHQGERRSEVQDAPGAGTFRLWGAGTCDSGQVDGPCLRPEKAIHKPGLCVR